MEKIRIQDDLYQYVNQEKLDQMVIPDDMPVTGGFSSLASDLEKLMINEFKEMCEKNEYPNEHLKNACGIFKLASDVEKKNALGIQPALHILEVIKNLDSIETLNKEFKQFVLKGLPLPLNISVETDMKDTAHHCVFIQGPSVILPDVTYYKEEMAQQKEMILGVWSNMTKMILAKTDLTEAEQNQYLEDTLKFDDILAKYVKSSEEWSEYVKMYNPMKTSRVATLLKPIKFKNVLTQLFGFVPENIIVSEPRYFKAFKEVFNEETFMLYKHWAYVKELVDSTSLLSEELREIGGIYYRALAGIPAGTPVDKFAYQLASGLYSDPVGLYYGDKYFGEAAKKDITEIVYQIIDTYKERIQNNEFLEESTKEKAILKLSKIGVKMGYPNEVKAIYNKLVYDENASLYEVVSSLKNILVEDRLSKLSQDVDRSVWAMPGHMVNACYDPFLNEITFPAGILQAPFYSIKQTRSENLGGIGAVIGHEISHAFDSNGAKCDENGNLNNWWTKEDMKKFKSKINAMIKEFDGIELPWGKVNGKFTVSENIADNGGMAVTLHIMSKMENPSYEEYFSNWARVWCMKAKPEYLQLLLAVDVHGPAVLRANMQPRNFQEWYDTFNVTKKDKMYLAPSKRVIIW